MKESAHIPANKPKANNNNKPFFEKGSETDFWGPEKENQSESPFFESIQTKLKVGAPNDPLESQADSVASQVVNRIHKPVNPTSKPESIQKQEEEIQEKPIAASISPVVQRKATNPKTQSVGKKGSAQIQAKRGSGSPMNTKTQSQMESGFGTKLGHVNIHTDNAAVRMNQQLNAKAFTLGSDIFFNQGQYNPDSLGGQQLLAHELTHTIQQGGGIRRMPIGEADGELLQRLPGFITDELASYARYIPGYSLFTVIIEYNPLTGQDVPRNATNVVQGLLELIPVFGPMLFDELQSRGVLQDAFTWVSAELERLGLSVSTIENLIEDIWDDVDLLEGFDYNLNVAIRHFDSLLDRVTTFVGSLTDKLLDLLKEALVSVLEPILDEIPGYSLLTKIIGTDPIRGEPVDATMVEIIEEFMILIGKETELEQMRERGTLQETADWLEENVTRFRGLLSQLQGIFTRVWDAFALENLDDVIGTLTGIADDFMVFAQDLLDFGLEVAIKVLEFIKKALLAWLAEFANDVPGFHLVTVIIEKNPFTEERVPRTVENIIRGFMSLMPGGEAQFQQMKETGAIGQAAARIEAAMANLGISWEFVVNLFTGLWESFTIEDLITPLDTFQRIVDTFGEPIQRLFDFIVVVVKEVIQIILVIMNFPSDIVGQIISNAMQAFEDIKADPIGFLKNLLRAVKSGFSKFFDNIVTHLLNGVTDWLFGQLDDLGIQRPADFSLGSILDLVLQILGVSEEQIWQKLADRIGQERVDQIRGMLDRLQGIWTFVRDVMERGPIAIWEYIQGQISNLWTMVMDAVQNWIMTRIIEQVITKLLSMLDPTGIMAVVNSFIAFYRAIQSFLDYLREMLEIVNSFVAGVAEIARGSVESAANFLEGALADGLPIAIGFLANQVGLGRIAEKIAEMIESVREMVDQALDWLMDMALSAGTAFLNALGIGEDEENEEDEEETESDISEGPYAALGAINEEFDDRTDDDHKIYFRGENNPELIVESDPVEFGRFITDKQSELEGNEAQLALLQQASTLNTQLGTLLTQLANADPGSQPARQAISSDEHGAVFTQIQGVITQIVTILRQVEMDQTEYPPVSLPPFSNNVLAPSFEAHFITQDRITRYPETNVNLHRGNLEGWRAVQLAGLTGGGENWVRMHLLTARINGEPVDSNLTPARGGLNTGIMLPLESAADTAIRGGDTIWYKVTVSYQDVTLPASIAAVTGTTSAQYLASIQANWGTYEKNGNNFTEIPQTVTNPVNTSVNPPTLVGTPLRDIHDASAEFIASNTSVSRRRGDSIKNAIRELVGMGIKASDAQDLANKLKALAGSPHNIDDLAARIDSLDGVVFHF